MGAFSSDGATAASAHRVNVPSEEASADQGGSLTPRIGAEDIDPFCTVQMASATARREPASRGRTSGWRARPSPPSKAAHCRQAVAAGRRRRQTKRSTTGTKASGGRSSGAPMPNAARQAEAGADGGGAEGSPVQLDQASGASAVAAVAIGRVDEQPDAARRHSVPSTPASLAWQPQGGREETKPMKSAPASTASSAQHRGCADLHLDVWPQPGSDGDGAGDSGGSAAPVPTTISPPGGDLGRSRCAPGHPSLPAGRTPGTTSTGPVKVGAEHRRLHRAARRPSAPAYAVRAGAAPVGGLSAPPVAAIATASAGQHGDDEQDGAIGAGLLGLFARRGDHRRAAAGMQRHHRGPERQHEAQRAGHSVRNVVRLHIEEDRAMA